MGRDPEEGQPSISERRVCSLQTPDKHKVTSARGYKVNGLRTPNKLPPPTAPAFFGGAGMGWEAPGELPASVAWESGSCAMRLEFPDMAVSAGLWDDVYEQANRIQTRQNSLCSFEVSWGSAA
jgi:hypothetical protein